MQWGQRHENALSPPHRAALGKGYDAGSAKDYTLYVLKLSLDLGCITPVQHQNVLITLTSQSASDVSVTKKIWYGILPQSIHSKGRVDGIDSRMAAI